MCEHELYRKMYYSLFNHLTDAIELLQRMELAPAINLLMDAQQETEKLYIESEQPPKSPT